MDPELESPYPTDYPLLEHITGTYSPHSFNMTSCLHYLSQNYNHTASNSFQDILSQIPSYCQQLLLEAAAMDTHAIHPDLEAAKASTVIRTVLGIVYSLVMAVCGFGNLLLLLVIFCYKKSRSATNMLISNLCFADFCVAVFCIPLQLDYYVIRNQDWMWGGSMCKVVSFIRMLSLYVSTNTLLVISIDRSVFCYSAFFVYLIVYLFVYQTQDANNAGDINRAQSASNRAKLLNYWALGLGIFFWVIGVILIILYFSVFAFWWWG